MIFSSATKHEQDIGLVDKAPYIFSGVLNQNGVSDLFSVIKGANALQWTIRNMKTRQSRTISFGSRKGIPVFGCDINGDAVTDLVYRERNKVTYSINEGGTSTIVTLPLLMAESKIYCLSPFSGKENRFVVTPFYKR